MVFSPTGSHKPPPYADGLHGLPLVGTGCWCSRRQDGSSRIFQRDKDGAGAELWEAASAVQVVMALLWLDRISLLTGISTTEENQLRLESPQSQVADQWQRRWWSRTRVRGRSCRLGISEAFWLRFLQNYENLFIAWIRLADKQAKPCLLACLLVLAVSKQSSKRPHFGQSSKQRKVLLACLLLVYS